MVNSLLIYITLFLLSVTSCITSCGREEEEEAACMYQRQGKKKFGVAVVVVVVVVVVNYCGSCC
jgi:hypothetical protein